SLTWKPKVSKPSYKVPSASRGEIRFAYYSRSFEEVSYLIPPANKIFGLIRRERAEVHKFRYIWHSLN
ncbi:hypothetical protein KGQ29_04910, partial [Patescibacteria group bacterium]|nr:hypothetical protein [Patescibacteria group bacterium]